MKKIPAAPFLVSSSQDSEFTTIVAPDFICDANLTGLLRRAVSPYNQPTEPGKAIYLEIPNTEVGNIFLIFSTSWASKRYIGGQGDEILRDPNRPIPFIKGVVLREPILDDVVASINLEIAHQKVVKHYQYFWQSSQSGQQLASFDFFPKDSDSSKNLILLKTSLSVSLWRCVTTLSLDSRYPPSICSVSFSPNGNIIATRYDNQVVKLWNWRQQKVVKDFNTYQSSLLQSFSTIAFNPEGNIIATGLINKKGESIINIWECYSDREKNIKASAASQEEVYGVIFHNDPRYGKFLVTGIKNKKITLWELKKGRVSYNLENIAHFDRKSVRDGYVNCLAVIPSGQFMAGGDSLGNIILWNFENTKQLCLTQAHYDCVNSVAFSPKNQILASGSDDGKIKTFRIEISYNSVRLKYNVRLKEVFTLEVNSPVKSVVFSPLRDILASGSDDNIIRIWDVNKGKIITTLNEHKGEITSVSFSKDGQLASGSKDGTVKVWSETKV